MINFIKKPAVIILTILIVAAGAGSYFYFGRETKEKLDFIEAKRVNITQEINVTGKVKPAKSVDLAFETAGKVANTYVNVGNYVKSGNPLVSLENSGFAAQLAQSEAALKTAEAQLIQKTIDVENAKKNAVDALLGAYTDSDNSVRVKTAGIFRGYRTSVYDITYVACHPEAESNAKNLRQISEEELDKWKIELGAVSSADSIDDFYGAIDNAMKRLAIFRKLFDNLSITFSTGCTIGETSLDTYRTNVSAARASIDSANNNLVTAEEKIRNAKSALLPQEAKMEEAKANTEYYRSQLAKSALYAPISGIVTKQDAKVGEIVSANDPVVSLISASKFEIEANVPEADIAKLKIGDMAKITLDAYGNDAVFDAKVTAIDPAETVIDGVATYKTIFQFAKDDKRIKSGMTANIDALTAKRENVIAVPQRAIIAKNGDKFARILNGETTTEVLVKTGIRGSDGNIEITEGISEGDKVIVSF